MNEYEILLMLDPDLAEERQTEIVSRTHELVDKGNGTWLSHDVWGRRRLAYEIDHKDDGSYHLLQFDAEPATLDEITRVLKITDGVMRHMATRRVKGGGRVLAAFDGRNRVTSVFSTAKKHRGKGVAIGTSRRKASKHLTRAVKLRPSLVTLYRGRLVAGVKKGKVRFVGALDRKRAISRGALRTDLRRVGL